MGQITIQVGALSRSITADDAKMTTVLGLVVDHTGGPSGGTAAQRADWVLRLIKDELIRLARDRSRALAVIATEAGLTPVDLD